MKNSFDAHFALYSEIVSAPVVSPELNKVSWHLLLLLKNNYYQQHIYSTTTYLHTCKFILSFRSCFPSLTKEVKKNK